MRSDNNLNKKKLRDSVFKTLVHVTFLAIIFLIIPTILSYRISVLYPEIMENKNVKMYASSWMLGILIVMWSYAYHTSLKGSYLRLIAGITQSIIMIYWMWVVLGNGYAIFHYRGVVVEVFYFPILLIFIALSVFKISTTLLQFISYRSELLEAKSCTQS